MQDTWTTLPSDWKLPDVQAGLNVFITLVAFLASYIYIRLYWSRAAKKVHRGHSISLASLLTVGNPGEVLDTILVLQKNIFSIRYAGLWFQYVVICGLAVVAILSGPIARYATRQSTIIRSQSVAVNVPTSYWTSMALDSAVINATWTRLINSSFPTDQLLAVHPDNSVDWVYNPSQWKPDWTLNCSSTERTNLSMQSTQNDCRTWLSQFPGLTELFNASAFTETDATVQGVHGGGTYTLSGAHFFRFGKRVLRKDEQGRIQSMMIGMSAMSMVGLKLIPSIKNASACAFGDGSLYDISQIMVSCNMSRQPDFNVSVGDPTVFTATGMCLNYNIYTIPKIMHQFANRGNITTITKDDLVRFLQINLILSGTIVPMVLRRDIDVRTVVIQISVTFLAVIGASIVLVTIGFIHHIIFVWRHRKTLSDVPMSKIEWMMQSIVAEDRPTSHSKDRPRWNAIVEYSSPAPKLTHEKRRRMEFEAAEFNNRETTTWFLDDSRRKSSSSRLDVSATPKLPSSSVSTFSAPDSRREESRKSLFKEFAKAGASYPLRTMAGYSTLNE